MLCSVFAELEVLSCGCQAYPMPSTLLRKKFTPLGDRNFHPPSVVINLSNAFQHEPQLVHGMPMAFWVGSGSSMVSAKDADISLYMYFNVAALPSR